MIRSEGMMILWMPVLGHDHVAKQRSHPMDHRYHLLAPRNRERASITEVILHVDHQQHITVNQLYTHSLILTHLARDLGGPFKPYFGLSGLGCLPLPFVIRRDSFCSRPLSAAHRINSDSVFTHGSDNLLRSSNQDSAESQRCALPATVAGAGTTPA